MIVPYPSQFPSACIKCGSQKGPIYWGGTVTSQELGFYLCRTCAETIGVEYGFVEGEEMATLREAAAEIEQYRKQTADHEQAVVESAREVEELRRQLAEARAERQQFEDRWLEIQHQVADVRDVAGRLATVGAYQESGAVNPGEGADNGGFTGLPASDAVGGTAGGVDNPPAVPPVSTAIPDPED